MDADTPDGPDALPNAPTETDDNSLEFGAWWVENYSPARQNCHALSDLPATRTEVQGMDRVLRDPTYFFFFNYPTPTWTRRFLYGDDLAWEQDWKRQDLGGTNETYVDSIDLAYFAGHGSTSSFIFRRCDTDDQDLSPTDASGAWGTRDLDWVGMAACNVLDDPNRANWAATMNGMRLFMGYKTVMADADHGEEFAEYVRWNYNMTQAWFKAADKLQPQGTVARILAERPDYFYDKWDDHNSDTVVDNTYHWKTHAVGSEPARAVNLQQVTEMPILQVEPLSLSAAQDRFGTLTSAFDISSTTSISDVFAAATDATNQITGTLITDDFALELDPSSGLFAIYELDNLFAEEESVRAADVQATTAILQEDARAIAEGFLNQNGLLPDDAQFFEVAQDTEVTAEVDKGDGEVSAASTESILQEEVTNFQVIYSRIITYTPPVSLTASSVQQVEPVEFSVMGPGAKLKVYVDTSVPAALAADANALQQEAVIGGLGGYRQIQEVFAAGSNQQATTPVLPAETIDLLFNELEPEIALSYIPQPFESREILGRTLAYWEGPLGLNQSELVPVYALTVQTTLVDGSVNEYETFIPVAPQYMRPFAQIDSSAVEGSLLPGSTLTLTAADASQPLSALGFDEALDFALGTGDEDSYIYTWYLNEVSDETVIGQGRELTYEVENTSSDKSETSQTIILAVHDILSSTEPNVSTDEFQFTFSDLFLPLINR